jgi:hypothetical protein
MDNGMPYIKGCHPLPLQVKDERAMSASSSISAGLLTAGHPLLIDRFEYTVAQIGRRCNYV